MVVKKDIATVTEREFIKGMIVAYQKGYKMGFLDGKEAGREEALYDE